MLNKITSLLSAKVELEEMKLENGTVLQAENFTAGESVFIVTEDEKVPLPVGDYEMEDGKKLVIAEEGVIGELIADDDEPKEESEELDSQVATGSEPRDLEAEKDTEDVVEKPKSKSKKDLSDETEVQEEENLEEQEEEKDEMNKIVEEVVAAMTPIIDEMKQELAYVKEELGKMKDEELAKQEVKEQLSKEPATKAIKHNPESSTEKKLNLLSKNKKANSTMDRVLQRMSNINK